MTRPVGRPTVLTDEVLARIAELRAAGLGYGTIARELRIGKTTVYRVLSGNAHGKAFQNSSEDPTRIRGHP